MEKRYEDTDYEKVKSEHKDNCVIDNLQEEKEKVIQIGLPRIQQSVVISNCYGQ